MKEPYDEAQHRRNMEELIRVLYELVDLEWENRSPLHWWFASTVLLSARIAYWLKWGRKALP